MISIKPYLWTLGLLWGLPTCGIVIGYLLLDKDVPPGSCEGIGFGCTLSPADTLMLWAMLSLPVFVTAGVVGVIVVAVVQWLRIRREGGRPARDLHYMT
jgi:hypothetical protein